MSRHFPEADFSFTVERHGFNACKARGITTDVHPSPDMPVSAPAITNSNSSHPN